MFTWGGGPGKPSTQSCEFPHPSWADQEKTPAPRESIGSSTEWGCLVSYATSLPPCPPPQYFVLLLVIFLLEIIAGVLAYVYYQQVRDRVGHTGTWTQGRTHVQTTPTPQAPELTPLCRQSLQVGAGHGG